MIDAHALPATLIRAHDTLVAGCHFLGSGRAGTNRETPDDRLRARVIGNGLRELDRFLNLLIGEVARSLAVPIPVDEHHTANRLRRLRHALGITDPDHARLMAIGRSRACLFHCWGMVRRADQPGERGMTSGWWAAGGEARALRVVALGDRLAVSATDLAEMCRFYEILAGELLGQAMARPAARAA